MLITRYDYLNCSFVKILCCILHTHDVLFECVTRCFLKFPFLKILPWILYMHEDFHLYAFSDYSSVVLENSALHTSQKACFSHLYLSDDRFSIGHFAKNLRWIIQNQNVFTCMCLAMVIHFVFSRKSFIAYFTNMRLFTCIYVQRWFFRLTIHENFLF